MYNVHSIDIYSDTFYFSSAAETPISINISMETPANIAVWPASIIYTVNDNSAGHVTISINSSDGKAVRHMDCGIKANGSYLATWDGRDDNGSVVGNGNYSIVINYAPDCYIVKAEWGGAGSADGQFLRPSGIALDADG